MSCINNGWCCCKSNYNKEMQYKSVSPKARPMKLNSSTKLGTKNKNKHQIQ